MYDRRLPYLTMEHDPRPHQQARATRIRRKLEDAMKLPGKIKVSLWGKSPMVSPRAAALLRDPETRRLLLAATRNEGQIPYPEDDGTRVMGR